MKNLSSMKFQYKILFPLILVSIVTGISLYFYVTYLYKEYQFNGLVDKASAVILTAESTREFTKNQNAIHIFKVSINKLDDILYTVPIFSAIEVAKEKSKEFGFTLNVSKHQSRNPDNQQDEYENKIFSILEKGQNNVFW